MTRKDLANDVWRAADIMRRDDGTNGISEYIEQISWMFFLKVFEDLENRFEAERLLVGEVYERIIPTEFMWSVWTKKLWHGDEIIKFIDEKLFPFLATLNGTPERDTIGLIFSEVRRNKMKSPFNLKDVIDIIDEINFNNPEDSHILSQFYEELLIKLGKESGIAGEFYTPRPVVRLMTKIVNPELNSSNRVNSILDPFCGSCGFLVESYNHMKANRISATDYVKLQRKVFHGYEKKSLPYLVGMMNCILHGLLTPNIIRKNSLSENILNFGPDAKYKYILTNPPFGGTENKQIQQNFTIKVQATELLALQQVMSRLEINGRCGIVVPEGLLSRGNAFAKVKKELLENYEVHTIVSLPAGVFANVTASGQGPKTNLLFFNKNGPTKTIWYCEVMPPSGKKYTKAKPLTDDDLSDCLEKWKNRTISNNSWISDINDIISSNYDLTARNPNKIQKSDITDPVQLLKEMSKIDDEIRNDIRELNEMVEQIS
jgi:type I restriction enzyme M protein